MAHNSTSISAICEMQTLISEVERSMSAHVLAALCPQGKYASVLFHFKCHSFHFSSFVKHNSEFRGRICVHLMNVDPIFSCLLALVWSPTTEKAISYLAARSPRFLHFVVSKCVSLLLVARQVVHSGFMRAENSCWNRMRALRLKSSVRRLMLFCCVLFLCSGLMAPD